MTSIEYALLAALIAMAIIVGVGALGEANLANWSAWIRKTIAALGM